SRHLSKKQVSPPERHRSQAAVFSERNPTDQGDTSADLAISVKNCSIISPALLMGARFRPDRSVWRFDFERATGYRNVVRDRRNRRVTPAGALMNKALQYELQHP